MSQNWSWILPVQSHGGKGGLWRSCIWCLAWNSCLRPTPTTIQPFLTWGKREITLKRNTNSTKWHEEGFLPAPNLVMFLSFQLKIVPGLSFFIPKKSHLILSFRKRKNISQWGLVLHIHHAYIPFSTHNQRIIFSAIIINVFQTLPIRGHGTRKRIFQYKGKTVPS